MPRNLAALLAEDGAAPADAVERALARQREAGGALDTALLEVGAISEEVLVPLLARAAGVPAAPESAWTAADARARRVFPSRVAERHGLAPFALDGRELSLVATYPVDVALLDEISFMLSLHLTAHVGPEWRVRELIHRLYGSPLPARLATLAGRSGAPVFAPAAGAVAEPPREEPPPPPPPTGFERDESEPLEPLAAALEQALDAFDVPTEEEAPEPERGEVEKAAAPPEPLRPPADRTAPPRWTLDEARAALAAAKDRDEVVLAALRYARDFFEFAALFAVTRDAIAGHDALGSDDARERVRAVAIWAADAGMFRTVLETRSPYLGPVSPDVQSNQAVLAGLGRKTPRTALVCPVILRDRPVCVLYADNGEAPVSARRLGDLLLFLSTIGAALERIIRDRKERPRRRAPAAAPPPPAGAQPAAAPAQGRDPPRVEEPPPGASSYAVAAGGADDEVAPPPEAVGAPPPEPPQAEEVAATPVGPPRPAPGETDAAISEPPRGGAVPTPVEPPRPAPAGIGAPASEPPPEPEASQPAAADAAAATPAASPEQAPADAVAAQASAPERPAAPGAIAAAVASFDVEVEVEGGEPAREAAPPQAPPEPDAPAEEPEPAPPPPTDAPPAAEEPSPATAWRRTPAAESLDDIERQFFGVDDPWSPPAEARTAEKPAALPAQRDASPAPPAPQQAPEPAAAEPPEPSAVGEAAEAPVAVAAPGPSAGVEPPPGSAPPEPAEVTPAQDRQEPADAAEASAPVAAPPHEPSPAPREPPEPPARPTQTPLPVPTDDVRPSPTPVPPRPETPVSLADRALDADLSVAAAARETLASRRRDPTLRPAHEKLRRALLSGISSRATRAAHALGALRDVEAIPLLVQVLETSEPETARAAADALASITLQRIGTDARKWLVWWKQNRGRGRAEWLFSGLTSADRDTRVLAEAELRQAGDAPVEYSPDMPGPDRERAARAWAGWLARSGHVL